MSELPLPRLELAWSRLEQQSEYDPNWVCDYWLVYRHFAEEDEVRVQMGRTTVNRSDDVRPGDAPFRDGSHIAWDCVHLRMPAYVRVGDSVTPVVPRAANCSVCTRPVPVWASSCGRQECRPPDGA